MIIDIIQIVLSIILIIIILMQQRGTGLGSAFGGENSVYRTKRGLEKSLHYVTIALVVIFLVTAFINTLY